MLQTVIRIKITARFDASRRLRFEDAKRLCHKKCARKGLGLSRKGSCSERFFSWYFGFPLSSKTNLRSDLISLLKNNCKKSSNVKLTPFLNKLEQKVIFHLGIFSPYGVIQTIHSTKSVFSFLTALFPSMDSISASYINCIKSTIPLSTLAKEQRSILLLFYPFYG